MKVLVTGSSGHLAAALLPRLCSHPGVQAVTGVDIRPGRFRHTRFKALQAEVADTMVLVMRVYFEKPRTTVGWKGLINDPRLDDSFRINEGLRLARRPPRQHRDTATVPGQRRAARIDLLGRYDAERRCRSVVRRGAARHARGRPGGTDAEPPNQRPNFPGRDAPRAQQACRTVLERYDGRLQADRALAAIEHDQINGAAVIVP